MSDIQNKIEALRKTVADIQTKMGGPPPRDESGCCTLEIAGTIIALGKLHPEDCAANGGTFHGRGVECHEVPGVVSPKPKPKPKPRPRPGLPFRN